MILRRITDAFRKRDWFTVGIETLIVMFGVFLGLQVNNWNAKRIARTEANDLLQRMSLEAEATRADLAKYRDLQASILERSLKLSVRLNAIDDCLAMDDEMKLLILGIGDFPPPRFSLATANEAIDSGSLSALPSDDIRDGVRRIIDEMTFIDRQWERYVSVKLDSEKAIYSAAGISLVREENLKIQPGVQWGGIDQYAMQTAEGVCGKPEMVAFATNAAITQHVYTIYLGEVSEKLGQYAALLSAYGNGALPPAKGDTP